MSWNFLSCGNLLLSEMGVGLGRGGEEGWLVVCMSGLGGDLCEGMGGWGWGDGGWGYVVLYVSYFIFVSFGKRKRLCDVRYVR